MLKTRRLYALSLCIVFISGVLYPIPRATASAQTTSAHLVYRNTQSGALWIAGADGSEKHQLPSSGHAQQFTVSPDGRLVAYVASGESRYKGLELRLLSLSDQHNIAITPLLTAQNIPANVPGRHILYSCFMECPVMHCERA